MNSLPSYNKLLMIEYDQHIFYVVLFHSLEKQEKKPSAQVTEELKVDVSRLDLRVGRIITAEKHPDADALYVEKVDVGEPAPRTVVSGLVKHIPLDQVLIYFSLVPFEFHCMQDKMLSQLSVKSHCPGSMDNVLLC